MKTIFLALISLIFLGSGFAYAGDYTSSAHGNSTSGVDRTSTTQYGTGNCAHCHEQHASIDGVQPEPKDATPVPDEYLLFQDYQNDTYNAFCTDKCHRATGSWGGDDIASQYAKTYHHPTTGIHTPDEDLPADFAAGTTRHGYCIDCHNPHVAKKIDRTVGSNSVSGGPLLKVSGVNASLVFIPEISYEYELCYKCHSSWTTVVGRNIETDFDPTNASAHPVEATLTDSSSAPLDADQMLAPWKVGTGTDSQGTKTMYCSDCHGDDATTPTPPKGPHGSGSVDSVGGPKILKGRWPDNSSDYLWDLDDAEDNTNDFNTQCLCKNCHPVWDSTDGWRNNAHSESNHSRTFKCVQCHVGLPHGYKWGRLIADTADGPPYDYGGYADVSSFNRAASPTSYTYSSSYCRVTCSTPGKAH